MDKVACLDCHLQEASKLNVLQAQLTQALGRPPSLDQLSDAAGCFMAGDWSAGGVEYVDYVIKSAPHARRALFLGCEAYIASQARAILGRWGGASVAVANGKRGQRTSGTSKGGSGVIPIDDLILAGAQGLSQAACRYDPSKGRGASSAVAAAGSAGGLRFLTYAHSYIRKHMIAAVKDSVYNQVRNRLSLAAAAYRLSFGCYQ